MFGRVPSVTKTSPMRTAHGEFGSTKPEYIAAHRPEPLEGQFQADREQQQHDADSGEGLDRAGAGDRDIIERGQLRNEAAEAERADEHPDQDETDHLG